MAVEFSADQRAVIDHRSGNLLVSAAAGSGKTTVMVQRILEMIQDPELDVSLDELLVVTFTNAAAASMKEKIEQQLSDRLEKDPENSRLAKELRMVPLASIMTNHAFSLQIVKDYITRIDGVDPGFRVADETEIALLRADTIRQVLEDFYTRALDAGSEEDFLTFVKCYGGKRQDTKIEELLLSIYNYMMSDPNPLEWLDRSIRSLDPDDLSETGLLAETNEEIAEALAAYRKRIVKVTERYRETARKLEQEGNTKKAAKAKSIIDQLSSILAAVDAENEPVVAAKLLLTSSFPTNDYKLSGEVDETLRRMVASYESLKKALTAAVSSYPDEERKDQIRRYLMPAMNGMKQVLLAFDKAYRMAKNEKNIIEFSDFEHGCLSILSDPVIASAVREKYRYIFIDEYQDCNRLQEAIIDRIARKNESGQSTNVFMVGDVKQSIYRFRLADPGLFQEKYKKYGETPDTRLLKLNANYRSDQGIVDAVNVIFSSLMTEEVGGLPYGEGERLYHGKTKEGYLCGPESMPNCVLYLETGGSSEDRKNAEAEKIVSLVKELTESGDYQYSEIAVLLRSGVKMSGRIYEALRRAGIPAFSETTESFYDTVEIRTILDFLRVIDNPRQDIALMGALRSPIGQLSDDDLGRIRLAQREGDFYGAMLAYLEKGSEDETYRKVDAFAKLLAYFRDQSARITIHDLLWKIYQKTGYYLYASSMPEGAIRRANLDLLLEKSIAFEEGIYSGLYQFLRYIDQMDHDRTIEKESGAVSGSQNRVRIMTIHKSKGLEFPVVIVAGLEKQWNMMDQRSSIVLHDRYGIGAEMYDPEHPVKFPPVRKTYINQKSKEETIAEEIRLLYVAMTRAEERLFLIGSLKDAPKSQPAETTLDDAYVMNAEDILGAKSCLDWILDILDHKPHPSIFRMIEEIQAAEDETVYITPDRPIPEMPVWSGSEEERQKVLKKLRYVYPYLWKSSVPGKLSVSEVKHARMEDVQDKLKDAEDDPTASAYFAGGGVTSGARRGTAFHNIMAYCQMKKLADPNEREKELQRLVDENKLTEDDLATVNPRWIERFVQSDLYQRILASPKVYKEQPFILNISLSKLREYSSRFSFAEKGDENLIMQGIVDLFFEENGEIILVDYKTDAVLDTARVEGYTVQLKIYREAIESAMHLPVKEMMLYAVRSGKEIMC